MTGLFYTGGEVRIMGIVTLEEYQKYASFFEDGGQQLIYLGSAENILETYLGYNPAEKEYTHLFDGNGAQTLQLRARPVKLITVKINAGEIPVDEFTASNEFIYYKNGVFPEGRYNVEIKYQGGYSDGSVPELLRITVLRLAALLNTEAKGNIGVTSKSFGDSGSRTFLNNTDYNRYLLPVSSYCLLRI
jgi:hypothetical protein